MGTTFLPTSPYFQTIMLTSDNYDAHTHNVILERFSRFIYHDPTQHNSIQFSFFDVLNKYNDNSSLKVFVL